MSKFANSYAKTVNGKEEIDAEKRPMSQPKWVTI